MSRLNFWNNVRVNIVSYICHLCGRFFFLPAARVSVAKFADIWEKGKDSQKNMWFTYPFSKQGPLAWSVFANFVQNWRIQNNYLYILFIYSLSIFGYAYVCLHVIICYRTVQIYRVSHTKVYSSIFTRIKKWSSVVT